VARTLPSRSCRAKKRSQSVRAVCCRPWQTAAARRCCVSSCWHSICLEVLCPESSDSAGLTATPPNTRQSCKLEVLPNLRRHIDHLGDHSSRWKRWCRTRASASAPTMSIRSVMELGLKSMALPDYVSIRQSLKVVSRMPAGQVRAPHGPWGARPVRCSDLRSACDPDSPRIYTFNTLTDDCGKPFHTFGTC